MTELDDQLPVKNNFNKICDILGSFLNQSTRNSVFFFPAAKKKSHLSARVIARTAQLLTHEAYCPIIHCPTSAEIRAFDSQSDLRVLL